MGILTQILGNALKNDTETLGTEAADAGKQLVEDFLDLQDVEREQHPWTMGKKHGSCLYLGSFEQLFADCAEKDTVQEWKDCCHGKTKADVSAATAAASFKQSMSQGIFGMPKKKKIKNQ